MRQQKNCWTISNLFYKPYDPALKQMRGFRVKKNNNIKI